MKCHIIDIEQLTGENCGFRNCMATGDTPQKAVRPITLLKAKVSCFGEIVTCRWLRNSNGKDVGLRRSKPARCALEYCEADVGKRIWSFVALDC